MRKFSFKILALSMVVMAANACAWTPHEQEMHYWQKEEAHSALYLQGQRAQQTLEEDIAFCVAEINELVRLGATRVSLPEDVDAKKDFVLEKKNKNVYWNVPQRHGKDYVDHSDYHDFDGCMRNKGWDRVKYADYKQVNLSDETYDRLQEMRTGKDRYSLDNPNQARHENDPQSLVGKSGPIYDQVND